MAYTAVPPALATVPSAFSFNTSAFECPQTNASPRASAYRRPETPQLTLHEYRRFQQSPVLSASPELDHRRLRRKASSANLAGSPLATAFAWGPSSSLPDRVESQASRSFLPSFLPPPPTTPEVRPATGSPSLSSTVTTLQSTPTHTPDCRRVSAYPHETHHQHAQCAVPISSKRKFTSFQHAKRFPRRADSSSTEGGNGLWEVYAEVFDLAQSDGEGAAAHVTVDRESSGKLWEPTDTAEPVARRERCVRFEGVGDLAGNAGDSAAAASIGEEKDSTATSTFSLSKFEFPAPPGHDNWGVATDNLNSPKSPYSPATLHLHGTSFDLVNPHDSLLVGVHQLETPAEIDGLLDDYFDQGVEDDIMESKQRAGERPQEPSRVDSNGSRRKLYEDADSARRNILNVEPDLTAPPKARLADDSPLAYKSAPSLVRKNTNPYRKHPSVRMAAESPLGDGESPASNMTVIHRERKGRSQASDPFDLTISESGSSSHLPGGDLGLREDASPPSEGGLQGGTDPQAPSSEENESSLRTIFDGYDYTRTQDVAPSSTEVEQGLGDGTQKVDITSERTYGDTNELLRMTPAIMPVGQAVSQYLARASSIYPEQPEDNESVWYTEYTASHHDLRGHNGRLRPISSDSYANTSDGGLEYDDFPTIAKRPQTHGGVAPQLRGDWLNDSLPAFRKAQEETQHQRDVQKATDLLLTDNEDLISQLGSKECDPIPYGERRNANLLALKQLREENPAAVREASVFVSEQAMRAQASIHPGAFDANDIPREHDNKLQKRTSPFKSPLVAGKVDKGKGRARTDSFGSGRQLIGRASPASLGGGNQEWSHSQSSFVRRGDANLGDMWTPYGEDATARALQSRGFDSSTGSGSMPGRRPGIDYGSRQGSRAKGPSRTAMGGQTELRELSLPKSRRSPGRLSDRELAKRSQHWSMEPRPSDSGIHHQSPGDATITTTRQGPVQHQSGLEHMLRFGEPIPSSREVEWRSKYHAILFALLFPPLALVFGCGGLDWFIDWHTNGRIRKYARKQKRNAMVYIFPAAVLFWAFWIVIIVYFGIFVSKDKKDAEQAAWGPLSDANSISLRG
ncbi:Hypothetical predicted protein [Lecanosticta acicola]|uniref:Uncharacterized protein n=1 Tax=Lecanosticta acicola TaxID=111012 RepID=A0AAI8W0P5_9PEZI|nr:Hypothetical predicted protein [Lecanosticta acicola]